MKTILIAVLIMMLTGCTNEDVVLPVDNPQPSDKQNSRIIEDKKEKNDDPIEEKPAEPSVPDFDSLKEKTVKIFKDSSPLSWGENINGVIREIDTDEKIIALTFDACDGASDSFDEELINFLVEEEVPATLFIGGQWIKENQEEFIKLSKNPIFEIANHGYMHKPLSVTGERAYNIQGTGSVEEVFDEIYKNQILIKELTGQAPKYFRSGTAYYDDVAVEIIHKLGLKAVNYNALGDAGGTFNKNQIINALEIAEEGSIYLFHMNRPQSDIANGVKDGIKILKEKGFEFVQLQEYDDFLR